jgi:hypothetical protein
MLMPTLTLDPSSAGAPAVDPAAGAMPAVPDGAERFAAQLAQAQSALPTGQNLAAGTLTLQTVALGPALEVVTPPTDGPDSDSLAEFAKAQGLDDEVVAWLFSDATHIQIPASSVMALPTLAAPPVDGALLAAASGGSIPAALGAAPAPLPPLAAALPAPGLLTHPELLAAANGTLGNWLQQTSTVVRGGPGGDASAGEIDPAQAATTPMPQTPLAPSTWTIRSLRQDTPPAPTAPIPDMPVEILSLEIQEGLEALWDEAGDAPEDARTTPLSAGAGTGNSSGNSSSPNHSGAGASLNASDDAAPATALSQRAAGYQELSQRLGEALAQRVLGQIERGNWEMRLMLKPAKLGEVEVDLTLRSGVLDASFRASNPVTRDLLNEGLPRLREVLANAGMDIAGLNVGSGRNPQTGGNPTPRQARGPDTGTPAQTGSVTATTAASPRLSSTGSGWDVLV